MARSRSPARDRRPYGRERYEKSGRYDRYGKYEKYEGSDRRRDRSDGTRRTDEREHFEEYRSRERVGVRRDNRDWKSDRERYRNSADHSEQQSRITSHNPSRQQPVTSLSSSTTITTNLKPASKQAATKSDAEIRDEKLKARQAKLQAWRLKNQRLKGEESVTNATSKGNSEKKEQNSNGKESQSDTENKASKPSVKLKPVSLGVSLLSKKNLKNSFRPVLDDEDGKPKTLPKFPFLKHLDDEEEEKEKGEDEKEKENYIPMEIDDTDDVDQSSTTKLLRNGKITQQERDKNSKRTQDQEDEEEEEDPLDQFMATLKQTEDDSTELPALVMADDGLDGAFVEDEEQNPEKLLAALDKKNRKDIPIVDHSKMDYEHFRKSFYVEPAELRDLTDVEVDNIRLELDGVKVRGTNCPRPVTRWSQLGLPAVTMDIINSLGYETPTSIQAQAIPAIMSGRDVIGVAKTGSGKTMAFLLPLFRHIKDQRSLAAMEGPIAIVMTPTRELAVQIYRECKPFLKALNLRAVCVYGGSPIKDQIADLKRGAEIIVCTPGRMIDLLAANSGRVTNLTRVTYLVLDEADRMFDMGFEPQVMKIIRNIRPDRQTVLFSATFPRVMEGLARKILRKPLEIVVGARSVVANEVKQLVEVREERTKFLRTLELLGEFFNNSSDGRALIFVDRQESADNLFKDLVERGYPCLSIHGGKDQVDRDSAISDFKQGIVNLMIATSIAARGLDVKQLKLVINYDAPNHMEDYVHRVGRTGRAGNTGTAVTFITPDQCRSAMDIAKALKLSGCEVPVEVQKLADEFISQVKSGKERWGSGFGGNGLEKLDEQRKAERKAERSAYGEDTEEKEEEVYDSDVESRYPDRAASSVPTATIPTIAPVVVNTKSSGNGPKVVAGYAPDNHGPDAGQFWTTLEINDFPYQSRRALTNLSTISKIIETNSVSITNKGEFYPSGKVPPPNGPKKLYLLIEGQSEASVINAHKQMVNILISGIEQAASNSVSNGTSRYTVT